VEVWILIYYWVERYGYLYIILLCGRLRRNTEKAAWTRDAAAGFSGGERGGVRRARTDGVRGVRRARLRELWWC
jgi:hypothetical protein